MFVHFSDFCGEEVIPVSATNIVHHMSQPTYPYNYANNLDCRWYFTSTNDFVVIRFVYFSVDTNSDFLSVGYGHKITLNTTVLNLSGMKSPSFVTVNSSLVWMTFTTDSKFSSSSQWAGFYITLESSESFGMAIRCVVHIHIPPTGFVGYL